MPGFVPRISAFDALGKATRNQVGRLAVLEGSRLVGYLSLKGITHVLGMATQREDTDDPNEAVFLNAYRTVARALEQAVQRAQAALREVGKDAARLEGYTWHGNRHSFASRLVMAGVDLLTVQKLGGWRTVSMVQRYGHVSPNHLRSAVERLVVAGGVLEVARNFPALQSPVRLKRGGIVEVCDSRGREG